MSASLRDSSILLAKNLRSSVFRLMDLEIRLDILSAVYTDEKIFRDVS